MKAVYSVIFMFLLKTAIAEPQAQQSWQSTTSSTAVISGAVGKADSNTIGFADSNRNGFNPFAIASPDKHIGDRVIMTSLIALSVFAAVYLGIWTAIALQLFAFAFQPMAATPGEIYQDIYGRIQNQINNAINNKDVSAMVSQLQTLSQNVNHEAVSYLAQVGMTGNMKDTLQGMAQGSIPIPFVSSVQVDNRMMAINNLLSAPNNWYTAPSQVTLSTSFVLTGVLGLGKNFCLHTKKFNLNDGTHLVVDDQCNLNSLDDKLWAVLDDGQLVLRTNNGIKCVAYNSKKGDNTKKYLAIFDYNSRQCSSSRTIKLMQRDGQNTLSLYDGNQMLCIGKGRKDKDLNVIVNPSKRRCKNNNNLEFQTRIPVILNTGGEGGSTGVSVTPPYTFDEIGVQIFYFPQFAKTHLAALKEMYVNGESKVYAKSQFDSKVEDYKQWIETFVPVFELYSQFANINAAAQLNEIKQFYSILNKASLDFSHPPLIQA